MLIKTQIKQRSHKVLVQLAVVQTYQVSVIYIVNSFTVTLSIAVVSYLTAGVTIKSSFKLCDFKMHLKIGLSYIVYKIH